MGTNNTVEVSAICRDCKKDFSAKVQFYFDSIPVGEKNPNFATVTCPYGGSKDNSGFSFLFYSRKSHILYTVFASANFNPFEREKLITDKLLEHHISNSSFSDQAKLRSVERGLFLKAIGM